MTLPKTWPPHGTSTPLVAGNLGRFVLRVSFSAFSVLTPILGVVIYIHASAFPSFGVNKVK